MAPETSTGDNPLKVVPLLPNIAAEVHGLDLSAALSETQIQTIHDALMAHEVLVFPKQDITPAQQINFGNYFGELSVHPFSPSTLETPELIILDNHKDNPPRFSDMWHSDETFREEPPMGTILRAVIVPQIGGDTVFASMTAAYEGLSDRMQRFISGLEAIHDFKPFRHLFTAADKEKQRKMEDRFPNPVHPVVRIHPVTGKRVLFVNPQFTIAIKDMNERESRSMLEVLFHQAEIPEYQFRLRWAPNTMAFWDNRSVLHYAVHDYYPQRRRMERVTIKGDRPVGISDEERITLEKEIETSHQASVGETGPGPLRPTERSGNKDWDVG